MKPDSQQLFSMCEKPKLNNCDETFITEALKFYIATGVFENVPVDKISNALHIFLCENSFKIVPTFTKENTYEEIHEIIAKKAAALLICLIKHVPLNISNMEMEGEKTKEASNKLYEKMMPFMPQKA
tara:strand:- start:3082 stop:3462 length:381 start_codon:yes stop_codon:yes gene_type:complete